MAYEEVVSGEIVALEVGDKLEGKYTNKRDAKFGFAYDFETKDGVKTMFGSAVLDSRMDRIHFGDKVRIVREEDIPSKEKNKNPTKMFKVFIDK